MVEKRERKYKYVRAEKMMTAVVRIFNEGEGKVTMSGRRQ